MSFYLVLSFIILHCLIISLPVHQDSFGTCPLSAAIFFLSLHFNHICLIFIYNNLKQSKVVFLISYVSGFFVAVQQETIRIYRKDEFTANKKWSLDCFELSTEMTEMSLEKHVRSPMKVRVMMSHHLTSPHLTAPHLI